MKRKGFLYEQICSIKNLELAHKLAKRGKSNQYGVRRFNENQQDLIINLHHILLNKEFKTSKYNIFTLFEGKEREIYSLPYYPDRIVHWAIINVIGDIFVKSFIKETYSCIKFRGLHKGLKDLNKVIKNYNYFLKIDIKKFYPNVKNEILKELLIKKFKDKDLLNLLFEIIDSNSKGIPIGNLLSQFFGNFYLNYFDHFCKEELRLTYFRYCDDIIILGNNKNELRIILNRIRNYLFYNLDLELSNYQIRPISEGIDFLGYKSYKTHILLRKSIKKRMIKMIKYNNNYKSKMSYKGWLDHCNSINLKNKYYEIK